MVSVRKCISRLNGINVEGNLASDIEQLCVETKCKDYQAFVVCVCGGGGDNHIYIYLPLYFPGGGGGGGAIARWPPLPPSPQMKPIFCRISKCCFRILHARLSCVCLLYLHLLLLSML